MGVRDKFEKRLREKEQEIAELENKIREARIYVQALQDSMRFLPKEESGGVEKPTFRHGSITQKTYEVLKGSNKPMHSKEILSALDLEINRHNLSTLRGSIGAYIREGKIFFSPSPGTIGLIGVPYSQTEESKKKEECNMMSK